MRAESAEAWGAARVGVAAQVHEAVLDDEVELEGAHGHDVVVERGVVVPGFQEAFAVGVEEGHHGGEGVVVVVDYVGQVGHGFAALVDGCGEEVGGGGGGGGGWLGWVDDVDGPLPAASEESGQFSASRGHFGGGMERG